MVKLEPVLAGRLMAVSIWCNLLSDLLEEARWQKRFLDVAIYLIEPKANQQGQANDDGAKSSSTSPWMQSATPIDANDEKCAALYALVRIHPTVVGFRLTAVKMARPVQSKSRITLMTVLPSFECFVLKVGG